MSTYTGDKGRLYSGLLGHGRIHFLTPPVKRNVQRAVEADYTRNSVRLKEFISVRDRNKLNNYIRSHCAPDTSKSSKMCEVKKVQFSKLCKETVTFY